MRFKTFAMSRSVSLIGTTWSRWKPTPLPNGANQSKPFTLPDTSSTHGWDRSSARNILYCCAAGEGIQLIRICPLEVVMVLMTGGGGLAARTEPPVRTNVVTVRTVVKESFERTV